MGPPFFFSPLPRSRIWLLFAGDFALFPTPKGALPGGNECISLTVPEIRLSTLASVFCQIPSFLFSWFRRVVADLCYSTVHFSIEGFPDPWTTWKCVSFFPDFLILSS